MPLLSLQNLRFTYSTPQLLDDVTLHIERGERIGLVGRNGAGKSTLMKLIAGRIHPDDGSIDASPDIRIAELPQDVPVGDLRSVFDVAADAWTSSADAIRLHRRLGQRLHDGKTLSEAEQQQYDAASHVLADEDLWLASDQLETLLTEMQLPADSPFDALSAGMKRRVLLARALVLHPDILLLDEPTNHLDIDSIIWLQGLLKRFEGTLIFVTHDRVFLQEMADRIVEIDRGRVFDWTCDYATFLKRRDQLLEAEAQQDARFDKKLAEEERWIRQGIKARRTRNEGRVRALKKMREERAQRRQRVGSARLRLQEAERSGQLVVRLEHVSQSFGDHCVIRDFSTTVFRGDRIGIIGPNGIGKSTLLRIMLGSLQPTSGTVRIGTNLSVAYFDQLRNQLKPDQSARENVAPGTDFVLINGQKRHVVGYLQDFLFSPDRAQTLVSFLSGGERNRLLLARIMAEPANVLVLDEPTNDLDAETLELLEEILPTFGGTILLVSHDRAFLNNIVSSTIVFGDGGDIEEFDGGYDDWLRQAAQRRTADAAQQAAIRESAPASESTAKDAASRTPSGSRQKRLSSFEQKELEQLPERISRLEQKQKELSDQLLDPALYQAGGAQAARITEELQQVAAELESSLARWEDLETRAGA